MMQVYDWRQVKREDLTPLLARQMIHGETMTMARIFLKKGCIVPEHSHSNEQISTVESGRLKFELGGREVILEAGQSLRIPANLPHRVEALDDAVALDLFSPPREDWIRGDDAYLRK